MIIKLMDGKVFILKIFTKTEVKSYKTPGLFVFKIFTGGEVKFGQVSN